MQEELLEKQIRLLELKNEENKEGGFTMTQEDMIESRIAYLEYELNNLWQKQAETTGSEKVAVQEKIAILQAQINDAKEQLESKTR